MPTIADVRAQFPQYQDMSDAQLGDALHRKFYSDMPRAEFDKRVGVAAQPAEQATDINGSLNAASGGFVRGLPVVGPYLDEAAQSAAAGIRSVMGGTKYADERKAVGDYAKSSAEAHPALETTGNIAGAIASTPVLPARALGMVGNTLGSRVVQGALGMGALGGADAAVRGEDPLAGAAIWATGGAVAPAIGGAFSRAMSPIRTTPERAALVDGLRREGVDLTAGQATGSRPLLWAESTLGDMPFAGGKPAEIMNRQGQQFTGAALSRAGENAPLATPEVMKGAADRIGAAFDDLSARNTLRYDPQFAQDIGKVVNEYGRVLPSEQRGIVMNIIQDLAQSPQGLPGDVYQNTRSRLSKYAKNLSQSDPNLSEALGGIRDSLDSAMSRSISPKDQAAWTEARRQYANMKTIEKAMGSGGERAAEGYLLPAKLGTAVRMNNRPAYVRGQGDLAELARVGTIMNPLPQSGTAPRAMMQGALAGGGIVHGLMSGDIASPMVGIAAPAVLGRALMSAPVQRYLGNQLATSPGAQEKARMIAALLLAPARQQLSHQSDRSGVR